MEPDFEEKKAQNYHADYLVLDCDRVKTKPLCQVEQVSRGRRANSGREDVSACHRQADTNIRRHVERPDPLRASLAGFPCVAPWPNRREERVTRGIGGPQVAHLHVALSGPYASSIGEGSYSFSRHNIKENSKPARRNSRRSHREPHQEGTSRPQIGRRQHAKENRGGVRCQRRAWFA